MNFPSNIYIPREKANLEWYLWRPEIRAGIDKYAENENLYLL